MTPEAAYESLSLDQERLRDYFKRVRIITSFLQLPPRSYGAKRVLEDGISRDDAVSLLNGRLGNLGRPSLYKDLFQPIMLYGEAESYQRFLGLSSGRSGVVYHLTLNEEQIIEANCYLQLKKRDDWKVVRPLTAPTADEIKTMVLYGEWATGQIDIPIEKGQPLLDKLLARGGS